jgi:DNA-binding NarL/FixJ family response regulator
MRDVQRIAIVDPCDATREPLRNMLLGIDSVWLEAECSRYGKFLDIVGQSQPDVVIVALDANPVIALHLIGQLAQGKPGRPILAVSGDASLLLQALRGGAREILTWPLVLEELLTALRRLRDGGTAASCASPAPAAAPSKPRAGPIRASQSAAPPVANAPPLAPPPVPVPAAPVAVPAPRPAPPTPGDIFFPPQPLLRRLRRAAQRLWRRLPFSGAAGDLVDCTVFAPPAVRAGATAFVQVFAHLPEQADSARAHAQEFDAAAARRGFKSLEAEVPRGARLTFHLVMPGTTIDDPVQHLVWRGQPASVQFGVHAPDPATLVGTVGVSRDGIPLGYVKFKLDVSTILPVFGPARPAPVGEAAHRYRKAFISYASPDRPEVLKRVQMLGRLGIDYFQDVLKLEPGDRWEKQLYRHIAESDLFLLFWSTAARNSEWVLKELRYALERKGDDDLAPPEIAPVVIEGPPPPPPPPELAHLHFNDYLLYFMVSPEKQARA